ncbi:MAG TPA: sugar transferase [Anaerolineaceae bacterium]|nr:sugar transferase [Anaerolineaceae bacterium]HQH85603.1 sugar transferase [Anaerolineaceae bacterium]
MQTDKLSEIESQPVPRSSSRSRQAYYLMKRCVDVLLSFIVLVLLLPILLVLALVIRLDSPGPVIYHQTRVGARRVGGQWQRADFTFFKLRTMRQNTDASLHQAYVHALIQNNTAEMAALQGAEMGNVNKLVHDPRITRIGHFLRKYSIDELPQFFNVLRGDMSLVGPRPALPYEIPDYQPWMLERLQAPPGITGLQQITARCTADFASQVRLDIEYIHRQSLWLDFVILFKTPFAVLRAEGAC